jgi:Uma2 family endonuclease
MRAPVPGWNPWAKVGLMALTAGVHHYSYRDYLALEESSNVKHEYLRGEIYGMAGGTPEHAALSAAVAARLAAQLEGGPCRVYSSDLRVRVAAADMAAYPDVTVIRGPVERDPESAVTATNPTLVVEVLSDGTAEYDLGDKLTSYRQIPTLRAAVFVAHDRRAIVVWEREGAGWTQHEAGPRQVARIAALGWELDVDRLYREGLPPGSALSSD